MPSRALSAATGAAGGEQAQRLRGLSDQESRRPAALGVLPLICGRPTLAATMLFVAALSIIQANVSVTSI